MRRAAVVSLVLLLFLLSCASETVRPRAQQQQLAANDSPQGAIARFVGAYEQKRSSDWANMFTGDFVFEFSASTDPDLVTKYSTGWFKTDEDSAGMHLFLGYTPQGESHRPAATSINIDLTNTQPVDDNAGGIDPGTHKVLPSRVDGQILIPPTPPATDPVNFLIENNYNAIYLVRGDQAVGLSSSQPADTSHWYIYRWVDLTTAVGASAPGTPMPAQANTWGRIKNIYR